MCLFYILLFVFSYQYCSLIEPLSSTDISFFEENLFADPTNRQRTFNYCQKLSDIQGFDFQYKKSERIFQGVLLFTDKRVQFIEKSTIPVSSERGLKNLCKCSILKTSKCDHCKSFESKLRNGIFYCGDYRLCRQDQKGRVFIEQYNTDNEKVTSRLLFTNFKKIIQVKLDKDGNIYFFTSDLMPFCIVYNYVKHKKRVNKGNLSFSLKEYYTEKYPWMKEGLEVSNSIYSLSGDDALNVEYLTFRYFFTSLFERIRFSGIVDVCKKTQNAFLKTNNGKFILYNKKDDTISFIEGTPEYDSHDIDSWLFSNNVSYNPIKESLMGKYFQTIIMKLKMFVYNRILNKFLIYFKIIL